MFNKAKLKLGQAKFDFTGHTLKGVLSTSSQALSATFVGSSTDCRYADLTNEASNGSGYTTGGVALTGVTWAESAGVVTLDCTDPAWAGLTKTFKYFSIYDDTDANDSLIGFVDLDTGGGSITVASTDYSIKVNASGLETLT
jgi:hypothetical protein